MKTRRELIFGLLVAVMLLTTVGTVFSVVSDPPHWELRYSGATWSNEQSHNGQFSVKLMVDAPAVYGSVRYTPSGYLTLSDIRTISVWLYRDEGLLTVDDYFRVTVKTPSGSIISLYGSPVYSTVVFPEDSWTYLASTDVLWYDSVGEVNGGTWSDVQAAYGSMQVTVVGWVAGGAGSDRTYFIDQLNVGTAQLNEPIGRR